MGSPGHRRERLARLLVPFAVGYLMLSPAQFVIDELVRSYTRPPDSPGTATHGGKDALAVPTGVPAQGTP
jgi:hypothetical protein